MLNTSMNNEASNSSFAFSNMGNTWICKLLIHHFQAVVDSSTGYISLPDDGATSALQSPGTLQLHSIAFVLGCTKSSALDNNKHIAILPLGLYFAGCLIGLYENSGETLLSQRQHTSILPTHIKHAIYSTWTVSSGCQSMASFTSTLIVHQSTKKTPIESSAATQLYLM